MSFARRTEMLCASACATLALFLAPACKTRPVPQADAVSSAAPFASFSPLPAAVPIATVQPPAPAAPPESPSATQLHGNPKIVAGKLTVNGHVSPDAVRRILRQNQDRYRMCYEQGLALDIALSGRVSARFVIGRDGSVSNVSDGGSSLANQPVVDCIFAAVQALSFPRPEIGIATVAYSLTLAPR